MAGNHGLGEEHDRSGRLRLTEELVLPAVQSTILYLYKGCTKHTENLENNHTIWCPRKVTKIPTEVALELIGLENQFWYI